MISWSLPILLPPPAHGRPSFFCSLHVISLLSDCMLSRRALCWLWKNATQCFFFHTGVSRVINKSSSGCVGTQAGGLSSVPSGDDFPSQKPACYLSSIRLLCDKSQQYCHKGSKLWKVIPLGKQSPEKPCKNGQNGRNTHCSVLWRGASSKGSFQAQFTLHFKRKKGINWRRVGKKVIGNCI